MANVRIVIPQRAVGTLAAVLALDQRSFRALTSALSRVDGSDLPAVIETIATAAPSLEVMPNELVASFLGLDVVRQEQGLSASELADAIVNSPRSPATSERDRTKLARRLAELVDADALNNTLRTIRAGIDFERNFEAVRLQTDVRIIDVGSKGAKALTGMLLHSLKIDYLGADGESKSFFVTLDDDDLDKTINILESAKARSRQCRTLLLRTGMRLARVSDE